MTALWLPATGLLAVALAIYGAGSLVVHRSGASLGDDRSVEERCVLGFAIWVAALFGLATSGLLRPMILSYAVGICCVFGAMATLRQTAHRLRHPVWTVPVVAFLFASPLVLVFAVTVNPTVSWDGAVYHLALPRLYLEAEGFRTVPLLVYSLWPQAVELLYALGMAMQGYVLAKAMHFGLGLLVVVLLVRHGGGENRCPATGLLAAALFLIHDVVLFELRAAYVDLAAACFALLAFLFLERALAAPSFAAGRRELALSGLACGLLASTKVTGIVSAACLAALLLPRWLRSDRRTRLRVASAFGLPLALLWLPWPVRTWLHTGNPFYPLFWKTFGGPDWSASLGGRLVEWQRSIGMGREPMDYLLLPWRVLTAGGHGYEAFDGRLSALWLPLMPLALWRSVGSPRTRRALSSAALLFVTWALGSQQMRFLIPALPLLALAIADGASAALRRLSVARSGPSLTRLRKIALWAVIAGWLAAFAVTQPRLLRAGWTHLRLYADSDFEMPERAPRPAVFDAIARLPRDATVLLLNSNHLFHCERPCLVDSFFEASQISHWLGHADSPEEVARRLRERGVTHVAWAGTPLGVGYPQPLLRLLARDDLARPVFARGTDTLWSLETGPETGRD